MPDLMTLINRIDKFSNLLLKMTREPDNKKFWEMNEEFKNERRCDDLEDELEEKSCAQ